VDKPEDSTRVAILGGTGFVGVNMRTVLEAAGMQVGVFSRTTGCDLLDLPTARAKLDAFHPNYMINCAALVGSINFVTNFAADVVDVNMRILLNTYKIAQQMPQVVVINPIANCGYPGVMDHYQEDGFWDGPIHPSVLSYGSTRRMMWVLSKCYYDQYGVSSTNLIVPNMYGPNDSTDPNKTHALNALIIKFVRAVKYGIDEVEIWGTGKPVREWLYVQNFAEVVLRVIKTRSLFLDPVNVAQNSGKSVVDLIEIIRGKLDYEGKVTFNTKYQDGSPKKVMSDRQFRQKFPDFSFTSLEDGISETIQYYQTIL
jgi:GDP-L-fucose synthase